MLTNLLYLNTLFRIGFGHSNEQIFKIIAKNRLSSSCSSSLKLHPVVVISFIYQQSEVSIVLFSLVKRRLASDHHKQHDSSCKNIHTLTLVVSFFKDLRSHVL